MRTAPILVASSLALTLVALAPASEARTVYCTNLQSASCPGTACADFDLDGRPQADECVDPVCGVAGCCDPCPQPDVPAICKDLAVGPREPARVTVHYGTGVGCFGATITTCRLQHDPTEPSTPVWVCDDTRLA